MRPLAVAPQLKRDPLDSDELPCLLDVSKEPCVCQGHPPVHSAAPMTPRWFSPGLRRSSVLSASRTRLPRRTHSQAPAPAHSAGGPSALGTDCSGVVGALWAWRAVVASPAPRASMTPATPFCGTTHTQCRPREGRALARPLSNKRLKLAGALVLREAVGSCLGGHGTFVHFTCAGGRVARSLSAVR